MEVCPCALFLQKCVKVDKNFGMPLYSFYFFIYLYKCNFLLKKNNKNALADTWFPWVFTWFFFCGNVHKLHYARAQWLHCSGCVDLYCCISNFHMTVIVSNYLWRVWLKLAHSWETLNERSMTLEHLGPATDERKMLIFRGLMASVLLLMRVKWNYLLE